jgi:hypothetical protein
MKTIHFQPLATDIAAISKFPLKIQGIAFQLRVAGIPMEILKKEAIKISNVEEKSCGSLSFDAESEDDFSLSEKIAAPLPTLEVCDWRCENFDKILECLFVILAGSTKEIGAEMVLGDRRVQQIVQSVVEKIEKLKQSEEFGFSTEVKIILSEGFLKRIDFVFKGQDDLFGGQV